MIIIMIFIIISYLLIYSFNDLDSIFNIQKAICNPHSIILHLAIETASDILEKLLVHVPKPLVCDHVYEHIDGVHPPVPGIEDQVPEHINLQKLSFVKIEYFGGKRQPVHQAQQGKGGKRKEGGK